MSWCLIVGVSLGQHLVGGGLEVLTATTYRSYSRERTKVCVPGQSVDSALDKNQPELGVFVLPVSLQMLPDGDGLLDQVVHVLGQLGGHALPLEDTQDLVAGDESHLDK